MPRILFEISGGTYGGRSHGTRHARAAG